MLFYNHKQEFIGIDEEGLKLLNYATLEELLGVCSDVADLFAKEPGYIHNFKNFGWIDFLLHADSDATSAIVNGNGRTFSCTLTVQKLFMVEEPSGYGYIIDMTHVKSISGEELKPYIAPSKPAYESAPVIPEKTAADLSAAPSVLPDYGYLTPTVLSEPDTLDVPSFTEEEFTSDLEPLDDLYAKLSVPASEEAFVPEEILPQEVAGPEETLPEKEIPIPTVPEPRRPEVRGTRYSDAEQVFINNLKIDKSYRFDPRIAANELGLPVDLIEEFIGDFIQQAHDFKDELFEAVLKGDMNNLKILSHKLKGVAANLRIEDAFETLSIINTSNDPTEIEANLKYFYSVIAKLESKGEEVAAEEPLIPLQSKENTAAVKADALPSAQDEGIYAFALKQNPDEPLLVHEEELYVLPDIQNEPFETAAEFVTTEEALPPQEEELYSFQNIHEEPYETATAAVTTEEALSPQEEELYSFPNIHEESFGTAMVPETINEISFGTVEAAEDKLHYDAGAIAGALGIELPFFEEILGDYKREAFNAAERISGAISAFDTHSWKKSASELKGISDNLRLNEISDQLAILSQTNDAQEANKASKRLIGYIAQL
jgi:hypothetical protein